MAQDCKHSRVAAEVLVFPFLPKLGVRAIQ